VTVRELDDKVGALLLQTVGMAQEALLRGGRDERIGLELLYVLDALRTLQFRVSDVLLQYGDLDGE
jgi:hypothetical protein